MMRKIILNNQNYFKNGKKETKRDLLCEIGYENVVVFDGPNFDNSIIGVSNDDRAVYSSEAMAKELAETEDWEIEDAIDYNTMRALPYIDNAPIVVYDINKYLDDVSKEEIKFDAKIFSEKCIQWIKDWFEKNGPDCNAVIGMSGGKDSSVVAALCVKALGADRVIGVAMPDGEQGLNEADEICNYLGIKCLVRPITEITKAFHNVELSEQAIQNIPPRIRMTMLYSVAQTYNGRVMGTCNASENYVGYFTRYGDGASDCEPIGKLTVRQVVAIGKELGLPIKWVEKTPDDGLPGSQPDDEKFAKWGFSYEKLDKLIEEGTSGDDVADEAIMNKHYQTLFKMKMGRIYNPFQE